MINNIIFDMVGVVLRFDTEGYFREHGFSDEDRRILKRGTIRPTGQNRTGIHLGGNVQNTDPDFLITGQNRTLNGRGRTAGASRRRKPLR